MRETVTVTARERQRLTVAMPRDTGQLALLRARHGRVTPPTRMPRLLEQRREDLVVVGGVGMWAGAAAAVHISTPHRPAPDHPWRRSVTPGG